MNFKQLDYVRNNGQSAGDKNMPFEPGNFWNCTDLTLSKTYKNTLQQQLFNAFKKEIENGFLLPGDIVPSTRELSKRLGLSRVTVLLTYNRLIEQGFLESKQSLGTFVRSSIPRHPCEGEIINFSTLDPQTLSQHTQRVLEQPPDNCSSANQTTLHYGLTPTELLPIRRWKQLLSKAVSEVANIMDLDALGSMNLRETIADYLKRSRSVVCSPQQIAICSNSQIALSLLSQLLLNERDTVIVEEPGFGAARKSATAHGAVVKPVPVDSQGAVVDELMRHPAAGFATNPKLVYLSPSHQDPTGAILSLERRKQLVEWNRSAKVWIIEDDIDCEYRLGSPFTPTILSLDDSNRVIYINSFWRTLYPLCSLSFVVIPQGLIDAFTRIKTLKDRCPPLAEQRALAHFISLGHLEQQVRQTSNIYSARKRALISALGKAFGTSVTISRQSGALCQLLKFNLTCDDSVLLECAQAAGLKMVSTRDYYIGTAARSEFLISFGHSDEEAINKQIMDFAQFVLQRNSHNRSFRKSTSPHSMEESWLQKP